LYELLHRRQVANQMVFGGYRGDRGACHALLAHPGEDAVAPQSPPGAANQSISASNFCEEMSRCALGESSPGWAWSRPL
jgi:hypothetical protein